jgi:hypothetical protein
VTLPGSEPVQEKSESEMNSCNGTHHRERDEHCRNSAEQPYDESHSTEEFPNDHKKGENRRNVQIFKRTHTPGKSGTTIPPEHVLSAVGKEYDSQYDPSDPHDPVSVRTCETLDHRSVPSTANFLPAAPTISQVVKSGLQSHAAASAKEVSISATSSSVRRNSPARITPSA